MNEKQNSLWTNLIVEKVNSNLWFDSPKRYSTLSQVIISFFREISQYLRECLDFDRIEEEIADKMRVN